MTFRLVNHCSARSSPALLLHPSTTVTTSSETLRPPLIRKVRPPEHAAAEQALALGCGQGPGTEQRDKNIFKKPKQNRTGPNPLMLGLEQWLSALELKI